MSVRGRWTTKLSVRRELLATARASVAYWARRAGSARGRQMLAEARTRRALRERQVTEAERVLDRHPGQVTTVSVAGVAMVAGFEGFRSRPYRNFSTEPLTIGYGETEGVRLGMRWTRAYALSRLRVRIAAGYAAPVLRALKAAGYAPSQSQFDALVSLAYNVGPGVFDSGRTMGDAIRSGERRRIANAFLVYDVADGRRWPGLTRRRKAERALYLKG